MSRRSIIIWSSVAAGVLILAATPFLLPLDTYRAPLERAASGAIGRPVSIQGPMRLTVYPNIGVSLSDVSIANAEGARDAEMMTVDTVIVGARLMPLFSGRLEVTEVTLARPVIHLETSADGSANWMTETANAGQPAAIDSSQFNRIGLAHLRINDGTLTYYDAKSGESHALERVSMRIDMAEGRTLAVPMNVSGTLTYNAQELRVSGRVENVQAALNAQPTAVRFGVNSNIINGEFTGTMGAERALTGALKLGARSLRALAAWTGHPMPPGNGFGLMALDGQAAIRNGVYTLSHAQIAFDSMTLNADMSIDTNPAVLAIDGRVTINKLDMRPYLAPGTSEDTVTATRAQQANPDAPLALDWLKFADANLTLVLGGLTMPNFHLDQAVVTTTLKGGKLQADMSNVAAYGGTGKGSMSVDASGAVPSFRNTLDITGIRAQPFLADFAGVRRISGTGSFSLDATSRGETPSAIVKALSGRGQMRFSDGAITGVDLSAVSRVLQTVITAPSLGNAVGEGASTPFAQMNASFTIRNGVLHTNDFLLTGPAVQMRGEGDVDLPAQTLAMHFEPRARGGIPGVRAVDIGIPFNVRGPWASPSFVPDAQGIAKGIVNRLQESGQTPADVLSDPAAALKSLFGGAR